jgi:hypothetical protein
MHLQEIMEEIREGGIHLCVTSHICAGAGVRSSFRKAPHETKG